MVEVKNAYENDGCWTNSRSAKKNCGEWIEVSNENYRCLTNGRFEERKKMGIEQMVD